ncbi:hypothetical protein BH11ARM1_BH11ARM1_13590 [soil metagenome]
MIAVASRVKSIIATFGDSFTISAVAHRGVFSALSEAKAATYLTSSEIAAASRPIYAAYVESNDTSAVANTVVWNGLSLTIIRIVGIRFANATIAKALVMA